MKTIIMEPLAGAHISECIRLAVMKCCETKCDVQFKHNVTEYTIRFYNLIDETGYAK